MSQLNSTIAVCYADTWMERISDTIQHQMSGDDIMIIRNVKTNFYKILTGYLQQYYALLLMSMKILKLEISIQQSCQS